ncbi:MAG: hypothetical protein WDM80_16900 [Limisphaerales bacterium]
MPARWQCWIPLIRRCSRRPWTGSGFICCARSRFAAGDLEAALPASTNLLQIVRLNRDAGQVANISESVAMRAEIR